jgi:hypothetical protein
MLIFNNKDSEIKSFIETVKPSIENHEAVFMLSSVDEIEELEDDSLLLDVSCFKINELFKINLDKFKDIYLLFNSKDLISINNTQALIETCELSKVFDVNFEGCSKLLLNAVEQNRKKREETLLFKNQVIDLSRKLEMTLDQFDTELNKIKKVYKKMVPFRQSVFKGIEFKSKFFTGESAGGEYFDISESGQKLILGASSCSSYLMSSCYMTHFSNLKKLEKVTDQDIKTFIKVLDQEYELINESSNKEITFENFILSIDLSTFEINFQNNGNFILFGRDGIVITPSNGDTGQGELKRGEKYILISPGYLKNWEYYGNSEFVFDEIKGLFDNESADLIDELSIKIKSEVNVSFLKHDASIISIEVGENVIHTV